MLKRIYSIVLVFLLLLLVACTGNGYKEATILETTDLHGVLWPYDYIEGKDIDASLASLLTYINNVRSETETVVLLDNGDNIQGQPSVYYYNYIDTITPHMISRAFNYMKYDAGAVGNHDIEAGHSVYDRLVREYDFPLLAANAVDSNTGEPYFKPFHLIKKNGLRIAIFGLVTPAIPTWLPEELYSGIEFLDMTETAKKWMPVIKQENPDIIIGLFHSGWDRSREQLEEGNMDENGSASVAFNVPGFDIIFTGHDHRTANEYFLNSAGDTILILNGGSRGQNIARADVKIGPRGKNGKKSKKMTGSIINAAGFDPDTAYMNAFRSDHEAVSDYVGRVIGRSAATISSRDAYFGPSAFVDLLHSIQFEITGADVSFAAPLSFDVSIAEGDITVGDMFKLYRFENMLYTMNLSGAEIRDYLEFSYSGWFNTVDGPDDFVLKFREGKDGKVLLNDGRAWLRNQPYNFDSAAGIEYSVDIRKPEGERISITGFTDGRKFEADSMYTVAVNSYRGNGGGGHFTEGAGLTPDDLRKRLVRSTDRDLRYYIMKSIESRKILQPMPAGNWKVVPDKWMAASKAREYSLLFGN